MKPPGKDSSYKDSINRMTRLIKRAGFSVSYDKVFSPAKNLFSLTIKDNEYPGIFYTNGKGASKQAALASGLGEFIERLLSKSFFSSFYTFIPKENRKFYHPEEKWLGLDKRVIKKEMGKDLFAYFYDNEIYKYHRDFLSGFSGINNEGEISLLPFSLESDRFYIPLVLLEDLYCTNGMSSGNTLLEAKVQALSEILERYVKFKIISEGHSLPVIPKKILSRFKGVLKIIQGIEKFGGRLLILDASLGGRFPVTCAAYISPGKGVRLSFGSHPSFILSLERTLTELFQGRSEDRAEENLVFPDNDGISNNPDNLISHFIDSTGDIPLSIFNAQKTIKELPFDCSGGRKKEYVYLQRIIADNGFKVLTSDFSARNVFYTRIIVPGMSEIYPLEDIEFKRNFNVRELYDLFSSYIKGQIRDPLLILKAIDKFSLNDFAKLKDFSGIVFNEKSLLKDITVAELKIRSFIVLKNKRLKEYLMWIKQSFSREDIPELIQYFYYYFHGTSKEEISLFFKNETLKNAEMILNGEIFPEKRAEKNIILNKDLNAIFHRTSDFFFNN